MWIDLYIVEQLCALSLGDYSLILGHVLEIELIFAPVCDLEKGYSDCTLPSWFGK